MDTLFLLLLGGSPASMSLGWTPWSKLSWESVSGAIIRPPLEISPLEATLSRAGGGTGMGDGSHPRDKLSWPSYGTVLLQYQQISQVKYVTASQNLANFKYSLGNLEHLYWSRGHLPHRGPGVWAEPSPPAWCAILQHHYKTSKEQSQFEENSEYS